MFEMPSVISKRYFTERTCMSWCTSIEILFVYFVHCVEHQHHNYCLMLTLYNYIYVLY